jgi:hypothetical protein
MNEKSFFFSVRQLFPGATVQTKGHDFLLSVVQHFQTIGQPNLSTILPSGTNPIFCYQYKKYLSLNH